MDTSIPLTPPPETKPFISPSPWRGRDVALITLGIIAVFALGLLALRGLNQISPELLSEEQTPLLSALAGALEAVALIGSVWLLGLVLRRLPSSSAGLTLPSPNWWIVGVVAGGAGILLSAIVAVVVQQVFNLPETNPQLPFLAPEGFSWFSMISMFVLGGIIAPFAEELYFRGVLYPWMRNFLPRWLAILLNATLFGVVHGDIAVGAAAGVLGLLLAGITEASGSVWPAVVIHVINNALKILLLFVLLATGLLQV